MQVSAHAWSAHAGAAALDKKAKKQFDATELAKLGARAEKAQRMPASVGKGAQKRMRTVRYRPELAPFTSRKQGCDSCCGSTLSPPGKWEMSQSEPLGIICSACGMTSCMTPVLVYAGLKRKHTGRAEHVQEEAVEAGHVSRQAIAKMRRKQKAADAPKRDAGLGEHGSAFRNGVLRVPGNLGSKPQAKAKSKPKQQQRRS